jgi:tRNA-dihydrouridine synthase 1
MSAFARGEAEWVEPEELKVFKLKLPAWLCQPYVRPTPEEHLRKQEEYKERDRRLETAKREMVEEEEDKKVEGSLSKKKLKKLEKNSMKALSRAAAARDGMKTCPQCQKNPASNKCSYCLCRACCKPKCYAEELDCEGHGILVKTKRAGFKRARAAEQAAEQEAELLLPAS